MEPELASLRADDRALEAAYLSAGASMAEEVRLVSRRSIGGSRTSRSELLCFDRDGDLESCFCKYAEEAGLPVGEYKRGVGHEARVYDQILASLEISRPRLLGSAVRNGMTFLFLEYLETASPMTYRDGGVFEAARWLGSFHRASAHVREDASAFLPDIDARFFALWLERAWRNCRPLVQEFPWLRALGTEQNALLRRFGAFEPTIIHGDFYPKNILLDDDGLVPVDWECTSFGEGAIDLAALLEGWTPATVQKSVRLYALARWGADPPGDFNQRLAVARVFLSARFFGHHPSLVHRPGMTWRFHELASALDGLGYR